MRRRRRVLVLAVAVAVAVAVAGSIVDPASAAAPPTITSAQVRAAKVGWSRFVADNFATPDAVQEPCPLVAADGAVARVQALGLVPSALPFGVALYRDATGAGIIGIVCGNDLTDPQNPPESTSFAVEATLLDGQAVFPQHVLRAAGQGTGITASPELGGEIIARCRTDQFVCVASWHRNGLVVTVKLDGPRTDQSEAQVRQLLIAVAPAVVSNLAAVPSPP
jgi:hypothetical protein